MSFLLRLVGVLAFVGTVGATASGGGQVITRSLDLVKRVLTVFELSTLRDRLLSEYEYSGSLPRPGDGDELATFIRDEVRTRSGGRDPSVDLWGSPYRFSRWTGADEYVLYSLGPDGTEGECDEPASADEAPDAPPDGADDVCTWLETPHRQSPFLPIPR